MASTKVTFVTGTAEVRRRDPNGPQAFMHPDDALVDSNHHPMTSEAGLPSQVTYVDGKCTCCPYGYHIDLDFLNFCRDLENGSTLRNLRRIQRTKRKLRKSMEIMLDEQDGIAAPPSSAPPDVVHSTEAGRLMHMVNYERSATQRLLSHIDHSVGSSATATAEGQHPFASTSDSDDAAYSPISPLTYRRPQDDSANMTPPSFTTSGRTDSMSSLSSVSTVSSEAAMMHQAQFYQQQQQQYQQYQHAVTQRTTTKVVENPVLEMGTAEMKHFSTSSSAQLVGEPPQKTPPPPPPRASQETSQVSLHSVREAMSVSLQRLRELEEQVKTIPILQVRISVLKEEKRLLNLQLKASQANSRSSVTTRSISVGHEKQPPATLPKPVRTVSVGVGDNSVIEPYNLQPHLPTGYTVRENEITTELYSSTKMVTSLVQAPQLNLSFRHSRSADSSSLRESRLSSSTESPVFTINQIKRSGPRPLTRTVGVGDGNVFDSGLHVHEKEFRTVLMGQGGVAKRNVGIDCRVPTRDVGVLFQCDEEKPETRTVGVNVNYDTSEIVTAFDFRGETELRMALRGVLQRNVHSVGTNCNFRPETAEAGTYTCISSGISVGTGDEQTMRTDVEIKPAYTRKSVGTSAKPDTVNKNVSTDRGWLLDASTNTNQVDRMHRSVMTEKQRQVFAATNTEPTPARATGNQTEQKMFLAMDLFKNASTGTDKYSSFSVAVNTDPPRTFSAMTNTEQLRTFTVGVNTSEKVADLFSQQQAQEQKSILTTTETTHLFKPVKPLMIDRGVGDGVIQDDEEQYSFSETTEVITRPTVYTVEEKILQRGANQASAFLTKSHEVSSISDTTSSTAETKIDEGDKHFSSFERSRRSTAPVPHTEAALEKHTASEQAVVKSPKSPQDNLFQETIVEHYIITKDGKKLISEEKTTKSSAGSNHSFKQYSDGKAVDTDWSSQSGYAGGAGSSLYKTGTFQDSADGSIKSTSSDSFDSKSYRSGLESSGSLSNDYSVKSESLSTSADRYSGGGYESYSILSSSATSESGSDKFATHEKGQAVSTEAAVVTNPYKTVENLATALSASETPTSVDSSVSKTRQVSKTSSEGNLFKVQKKSSKSQRDSLKAMDTIFDMRRTGSVEDFMPDNIRKYMSIDPSNSKDSGFGEDLLQRFSENSSSSSSSSPTKCLEQGMPYTVKVSKSVTTRRSTKTGDKVSVQETKTFEGEDGKVVTTVTKTDADGNTVVEKSGAGDLEGGQWSLKGSSDLSSRGLSSQHFEESKTGLQSSSGPVHSSMSYSESTITSVGQGSSDDYFPEGSYGSLDRRTGQLKSILKQSKSETDQLNERRGITFAETVKGGTGSSSEEGANSSDSDDSTASYDEGSYDSQQGQVIYRCEDDKAIEQGVPGAHMFDQNIRETYELTPELTEACRVLAIYLQDSTTIQTKELNASQGIVQQEWFQVSSLKLSSDHQVEDFLSSVNEISKRLLEYIVNMTDPNGNTAIHYCVSHCNFHIASLLLDSEVCAIDQQNKAGYTPIMLAGLAEVSNLGQLEVIRRIFSQGDVNARAAATQQTALMLAASHGREKMVKLLVEAGADLNAQDVDGSTALMCACEHGHLEIVNFLLSQPAIDAGIVDNENSTALTVAMEAGHKDVGVVLYKHLNFSKPSASPGTHRKRKGSSSPTPSH